MSWYCVGPQIFHVYLYGHILQWSKLTYVIKYIQRYSDSRLNRPECLARLPMTHFTNIINAVMLVGIVMLVRINASNVGKDSNAECW